MSFLLEVFTNNIWYTLLSFGAMFAVLGYSNYRKHEILKFIIGVYSNPKTTLLTKLSIPIELAWKLRWCTT